MEDIKTARFLQRYLYLFVHSHDFKSKYGHEGILGLHTLNHLFQFTGNWIAVNSCKNFCCKIVVRNAGKNSSPRTTKTSTKELNALQFHTIELHRAQHGHLSTAAMLFLRFYPDSRVLCAVASPEPHLCLHVHKAWIICAPFDVLILTVTCHISADCTFCSDNWWEIKPKADEQLSVTFTLFADSQVSLSLELVYRMGLFISPAKKTKQ